jgi:hypothetical protein
VCLIAATTLPCPKSWPEPGQKNGHCPFFQCLGHRCKLGLPGQKESILVPELSGCGQLYWMVTWGSQRQLRLRSQTLLLAMYRPLVSVGGGAGVQGGENQQPAVHSWYQQLR